MQSPKNKAKIMKGGVLTSTLVPFKSSLKKAEQLEAVFAAIERAEQAAMREIVETSVELADVEAGEEEAKHEDAPVDEDMDD
jgi:hypothetical protein